MQHGDEENGGHRVRLALVSQLVEALELEKDMLYRSDSHIYDLFHAISLHIWPFNAFQRHWTPGDQGAPRARLPGGPRVLRPFS